MPIANQSPESAAANRRSFQLGHGKIALSATALTAHDRLSVIRSPNAETVNKEVSILSATLRAEQEAVAASQLGVNAGLLQQPVIDLAARFEGHHQARSTALEAPARKLGGTEVEAPESRVPCRWPFSPKARTPSRRAAPPVCVAADHPLTAEGQAGEMRSGNPCSDDRSRHVKPRGNSPTYKEASHDYESA